MNIFSKLVVSSVFTSMMMVTAVSQAESMTVWHVKGIHPGGEEILSIKAVDEKGKLHAVKAFFEDDDHHLLDIRVLDHDLDESVYKVKTVDLGHTKYHGVKAVSKSGKHLDIKAFDRDGKQYDVKAIRDDSNDLDIRVVAPDGRHWPVKVLSPQGHTHNIKAFDFENDDKYLHIKGLRR